MRYRQQAGQNAVQRSAHQEAIIHLTKGLNMLKALPHTPKQFQQELMLQVTLGVSLKAIKGLATPEVEKIYARALELCQQVGETPQLFPVLWGLWSFYNTRAELQTARELAKQLLSLAQAGQNSVLLLRAHLTLGVTLYCLGEFVPARAHLEQSIILYDPHQHRALVSQYGPDPGVICRGWAAPVLWLLGYPDQALQRSQEALTLARKLSHSDSSAFALQLASVLHQCRREEQATQEQAEALITLSNKQEFPYFVALGTILQGWALVGQGSGEEGITQIRQGLAVHRATGAEVGRSRWLALLVEAYEKVGQAEEGLAVVAEALATMDKTGERFYGAELYRLKGELTLQKQSKVTSRKSKAPSPQPLTPSTQEAEACFLKAIEISQRQQAKSLELRATTSLARLWQQQGKQHEARDILATVYNWFTEGFDTKDLQEAKTLLEELV